MKEINTTGFPSPAQGYEKSTFDFNKLLVKHEASTFTMRYSGKTIEEPHVQSGDLLIVDSSLYASSGKLVITESDGEFHCLQFSQNLSADEVLWGVVTAVVRLV